MKTAIANVESTLPVGFEDIADSLARVADFTSSAGYAQYLKFTKIGDWVLGRDEMPVEEDSEWLINPLSIKTGYSAFNSKGQRTGERMCALNEAPISESQLPPVDGGWGRQIQFDVKCISGEDEGQQAIVSFRSKGGLDAASALIAEIIKRIQNREPDCCPAVTLHGDRYKHSNPSYGYVYVPIFQIESWSTIDGPAQDEPELLTADAPEAVEPEPEPEPEEAPAPKRRTRRPRAK